MRGNECEGDNGNSRQDRIIGDFLALLREASECKSTLLPRASLLELKLNTQMSQFEEAIKSGHDVKASLVVEMLGHFQRLCLSDIENTRKIYSGRSRERGGEDIEKGRKALNWLAIQNLALIVGGASDEREANKLCRDEGIKGYPERRRLPEQLEKAAEILKNDSFDKCPEQHYDIKERTNDRMAEIQELQMVQMKAQYQIDSELQRLCSNADDRTNVEELLKKKEDIQQIWQKFEDEWYSLYYELIEDEYGPTAKEWMRKYDKKMS